MADILATPEAYIQEPVRFPPLQIVDVYEESASVREQYRNQVLLSANDHCLRLGVISGTYPWHMHPRSDELFFVLEGRLVIELAGGRELVLGPGQAVAVPAGTHHRTTGQGRTVNVCFELKEAETVFVPTPAT